MSAKEIMKALGGRWQGAYGMARCPVHEDRTPSLKILDAENGDITVHCFAGCDWRDVKDALRREGLLPAWRGGCPPPMSRATPSSKPRDGPDPEETARIEAARRIWDEALPATGTLVELYLSFYHD